MDEAELDRIDMCHAKYCALIGKNRYLSPIEKPQRILDLGCGTGSLKFAFPMRKCWIDSDTLTNITL
jgi:ubiquinone/menaquinone biosynthesis C-methylase UbiE